MKLGTVCYVPPRKIDPDGVFLANLRTYKTRHALIRFQSEKRIPGAICIASPEVPGSDKRRWLVSNLVFLQGLRIAHYRHLDYFIYLESDCRVRGHEWDEIMFQQFFAEGTGAVMGGSPVCWHPSGGGLDMLVELTKFAHRHYQLTGLPMPVYGQGQFGKPWFYPNGGGAIFHTATLVKEVFPGAIENPRQFIGTDAWDRVIGRRMCELYGAQVTSKFVSLRCAYSGYGNDLVDEESRKRMMMQGDKVMIHQIKNGWKP